MPPMRGACRSGLFDTNVDKLPPSHARGLHLVQSDFSDRSLFPSFGDCWRLSSDFGLMSIMPSHARGLPLAGSGKIAGTRQRHTRGLRCLAPPISAEPTCATLA